MGKVTNNFSELKFKRNYSERLPLRAVSSFSETRAQEQDWLIQRVTPPYYYYNSLALPRDYEYAEYPIPPDNPKQTKAITRPDICYELRSLDPSQALEQILIGLHPNQQLSIIVYFRHGVSKKCLDILRAEENIPESYTSPYTFFYADHVGFDIRSRAGQYIGCYNSEALKQVTFFMQALHQISPLSEKAIALWRTVYAQAISYTEKKFVWPCLPEYKEEQPFSLKLDIGWLNAIPDYVPTSHFLYHRDDTLNFPTDIPKIHLAVLNRDNSWLEELLKQDPLFIYRRDFGGDLAIELAWKLGNLDAVWMIYQTWAKMIESEKLLANIFLNVVGTIATHSVRGQIMSKFSAENYYRPFYPGMPHPDKIHDYVRRNDNEGYQSFWQQLIANAETEEIREKLQQQFQTYSTLSHMRALFDSSIPRRSSLHQGVLAGSTELNALFLEDKIKFADLTERLNAIARPILQQDYTEVIAAKKAYWRRVDPCGSYAVELGLAIENAQIYLDQCQALFVRFRADFLHLNDEDYYFYMKLAAISLFREMQKELGQAPIESPSLHDNFVKGWLAALAPDPRLPFQDKFACFGRLKADYYLDIARRGLLRSDQLDPWGYTPTGLAIVANNLAVIKVCAHQYPDVSIREWEKGLYALLDHAQGAALEVLCQQGHDPNRSGLGFFPRQNRNEYWLLMFYRHRYKRDYRLLTPIDRYLVHPSSPEKLTEALDTLDVLLQYHDEKVVTGPYDPGICKEITERFEFHNSQIDRRKMAASRRPRYLSHYTNEAESLFVTKLSSQGNHYHSIIGRFAQLSQDDQEQVTDIFCQNFYISKEMDANREQCRAFFRERILRDSQYLIETHYDSGSGKVAGFACFKFIACPDKEFDVLYFSIVAAHRNYARQGLIFSSAKVMQAGASVNTRQCFMYCRLGSPGLAYPFIPKSAMISAKYEEPSQYLPIVASIVNNRIESDGTSIPPVHVDAGRDSSSNYHVPQDEFEYLLQHVLKSRNPQASLPLTFELNSAIAGELQAGLHRDFAFPPAMCEDLAKFLNKACIPQEEVVPESSNGPAMP